MASAPPDPVPHLLPDADLAGAIAQLGGDLLHVIHHWAMLVPQAGDPEPVHQMRVGVRRLRTLFALFRKALGPDAVAPLETRLRDLGHLLGHARDWDVFLGGTAKRLRRAMPEDARLAALLQAGHAARERAYHTLNGRLHDAVWHDLQRDLFVFFSAVALAVPPADDPRPFIAKALKRRHRGVLEAGDDPLALPPAEMHHLRKRAKKLRYAGEFFRPLFGDDATRRFIRRANALQDVLGEVNDARTVSALMAELGGIGDGFAAGAMCGYAEHVAERARPDVAERWRKFRDTAPFWAG